MTALVRETTPDQLGLAGFLWTRDAVADLTAQRYGVWLARMTVGGYLRQGRGPGDREQQHGSRGHDNVLLHEILHDWNE